MSCLLSALERRDDFIGRHIGTSEEDRNAMLAALGFASCAELIAAALPASIRRQRPLPLPEPQPEAEALGQLAGIAAKNRLFRSFIGQGYYGTHTPAVIRRNILENPAWYTAYTPYQPEISQGRLEALLNFQTMVSDLTGMDIANASMLDEATAVAEAMTLAKRAGRSASNVTGTRTVPGTAIPFSIFGLKRHFFTASSTEASKTPGGFALCTRTSVGRPCASTSTCSTTVPSMPCLSASAG